jgi:hypothetical protein
MKCRASFKDKVTSIYEKMRESRLRWLSYAKESN